jgi:5,6-dimethylbenzimidazole synthase
MSGTFDPHFQNDLSELFRWRRDVRHFIKRPLSDEEVLDLLRVAQLAPSVGNSQPWRFVRILSEPLREQLAAHVDEESERASKLQAPDRVAEYRALKLHGLREASEVLAVFCDDSTGTGARLGAATMPEARAYSVVMAIHTFWLAAMAKGLGLGWVSILDPEIVATMLAAKPGWRLIALLCLGYPETVSDTPELERRGWQARTDWMSNVSER